MDVRQLPDWIVSNYFYNEMSPLIRWSLFPFLVLFSITILAFAAEILATLGIFDANYLLDNPITRSLGVFGNLLRTILVFSMLFWFFIIAVSVPLGFVLRDARRVLQRMKILPEGKDSAVYVPDEGYREHALEIFEADPNVAVYVFGHTHDAFLLEENGRAILNTGTWLKLLKRIPVIFGYLPAVYFPTFRLNYFKIFEESGRIAIEYKVIPKVPKQEHSLIQRILTLTKKPQPGRPIPERTVLSLKDGMTR